MVKLKIRFLLFSHIVAALLLFFCAGNAFAGGGGQSSRNTNNDRQTRNPDHALSTGVAEEIRGLVETGLLSSLTQALQIIQERNLSGADFGRIMNGITSMLVRYVYPDSLIRLPNMDLPQTYNYSRIIREAEAGNYTRPDADSTDFFEYILPFFAINKDSSPQILEIALNDLKKAGELKSNSVLPPYFRGRIYEMQNNFLYAELEYKQAYDISDEFYPALIGIGSVMAQSGRTTEAVAHFSDLTIRYPDSIAIKRQLALILYENNNWERALPVVDEVIQHDSRDGGFILMRAHILIQQGNFSLANSSLDIYAPINSNNRLYLFLRARVQSEGFRNRDSALNYLRSLLRGNPDDTEALLYAARLLLESQRPADQSEGREYLARLNQTDGSSIDVLSLSLKDAVSRESWQEAQRHLNRILAVRRTPSDLTDGFYVERGLGNNARALAFARELYESDPSSNDYTSVYIAALIDNNRRDEAARLLEARLSSAGAGAVRSRFYFLRSRLQTNEEAALSDLRSSLFEDPRNLEAHIAIFEIYHRRREERRAVQYLRQALAISPDNPRLRRYEAEYASLLGNR